MPFVLLGILGDNLGTNSLFEFSESFCADYWCRACRVFKYLAYKLTPQEIPQYLRSEQNHEKDVKAKTCGVKAECVFNTLPYFHCIKNNTSDVMYDIYLGVSRYDFARMINYFIYQKYFTLSYLNMRLKQFEHKKIDRGNKLSDIKQNHLDNGQIIITSAQMSFLVSYFRRFHLPR